MCGHSSSVCEGSLIVGTLLVALRPVTSATLDRPSRAQQRGSSWFRHDVLSHDDILSHGCRHGVDGTPRGSANTMDGRADEEEGETT